MYVRIIKEYSFCLIYILKQIIHCIITNKIVILKNI